MKQTKHIIDSGAILHYYIPKTDYQRVCPKNA